MANPNGRKGAGFETAVLKWLRGQSIWAERLSKAGANDEGDLVVIIGGSTYILELKNVKKIDLPSFWDEAVTESKNYAKARNLEYNPPAYVIVKRRNQSIDKSWVITNFEQWIANKQR